MSTARLQHGLHRKYKLFSHNFQIFHRGNSRNRTNNLLLTKELLYLLSYAARSRSGGPGLYKNQYNTIKYASPVLCASRRDNMSRSGQRYLALRHPALRPALCFSGRNKSASGVLFLRGHTSLCLWSCRKSNPGPIHAPILTLFIRLVRKPGRSGQKFQLPISTTRFS